MNARSENDEMERAVTEMEEAVATAVAQFPPLTDEQVEKIGALLREVPAPISSPIMFGRFMRKLDEMGVSPERLVARRDQIL